MAGWVCVHFIIWIKSGCPSPPNTDNIQIQQHKHEWMSGAHHIRKLWKLINLICWSVRATQDNGASPGRGGAQARARHAELYGRGRSHADCGMVQERTTARVRLPADDSASRCTLLLEGTYNRLYTDYRQSQSSSRHNKCVIYPHPIRPLHHHWPLWREIVVRGMFLLPKRAKSGNNISLLSGQPKAGTGELFLTTT